LLQLPVLVKYRIALVLVPLASDSRILSLGRQEDNTYRKNTQGRRR
jgi:hypothetical protein